MDYLAKIKEVLEPKLKGKELTVESNFKDFGVDSLDLVDLVFQMEEALGVEFEDEELLKIKTVNDLIQLVESKK